MKAKCMSCLVVTLVLLFVLAGSAFGAEQEIKLLSPNDGELVITVPKQIQRYLNLIHKDNSVSSDQMGTGQGKSVPVLLSWEEDGSKSYQILLSECEDILHAEEYQTTEPELSLINLKNGKAFYWQVRSSNGNTSAVHSFQTAPYTRWLTVKNMVNIRDIGGYKTKDGQTVKQGMLIRGGEIRSKTFKEESRAVFSDDLRIKTEIDLRYAGEGADPAPSSESPLGSDVQYYHLPFAPYGELNKDIAFNKYNEEIPVNTRENLHRIFSEVLTDAGNYPIYFHCVVGADRTGCLAFLINGMLGVDEVDLIADWEQTTFGNNPRSRNSGTYAEEFAAFTALLASYGEAGASVQTLCRNYLTEYVGITEAELQAITGLLLE